MRALLKCAAALLFVSVAATFSGCSTSEHSHHHGETHAAQSESAHGAATHQAETTVPDKTADVFSEIEKHFRELGAAIQSKDASGGPHCLDHSTQNLSFCFSRLLGFVVACSLLCV